MGVGGGMGKEKEGKDGGREGGKEEKQEVSAWGFPGLADLSPPLLVLLPGDPQQASSPLSASVFLCTESTRNGHLA